MNIDQTIPEAAIRLSMLRHLFSQVFPEQVKLDFTVAICTYNGEHRLPAVLECLRWQLNTSQIAWEVIVVDNNSTDQTAEVVRAYQAIWPDGFPLRYLTESRQGAGYARHTAVRAARSPLIGFLDDDNLPAMTWVTGAYRFGQAYPQVGVYGSRIQGEFETTPPPNFERIAALLALTERGAEPKIYQPEKKVLPPGAGMVVRRQAWLDHVPPQPVLTGRDGKSMLTGEDLESILHIQRAGWEVWYNPHMRVFHRIPSQRLNRAYLKSLCRGIGYSRYRTRMLSVSPWQRPLMLLAYAANDVRKILRHLLKYRSAVVQDDVAACEMTLYVSSLISPLFMAYRAIAQFTKSTSAIS